MTQKFIPILFSTEMINAILEGRKTQTRRAVKFNNYLPSLTHKHHSKMTVRGFEVYDGNKELDGNLIFRHGNVDDILWVRETFTFWNDQPCYKADNLSENKLLKWKPSIFMPKEASRIFLKVTNVRVERLNDISESDAIAEGVEKIADYGATGYKLYTEPEASYSDIDAVYSFESLWESINGKESLDANPFVWVIEFEKIDKPENFI